MACVAIGVATAPQNSSRDGQKSPTFSLKLTKADFDLDRPVDPNAGVIYWLQDEEGWCLHITHPKRPVHELYLVSFSAVHEVLNFLDWLIWSKKAGNPELQAIDLETIKIWWEYDDRFLYPFLWLNHEFIVASK